MILKNSARKISYWNRMRKWLHFTKLFSAEDHPKILDVGFTNSDGNGIINTNWLEKNYKYLEDVTALGVEDGTNFREKYPQVNTITYEGNIFPFHSSSFDIVFANAVLEHVRGGVEGQILFVKEMCRVSKKICYFTTPNRYFPVELHSHVLLLHWLPKNWFDVFLNIIGQSERTGNYMNLLGYRNLKYILKEAGVKQYKIKRNRIGCFTLDFSVIVTRSEKENG